MVLAKGYDADSGYLVFYTHFGSRKGAELDATGRAAGVFYWEEFGGRQLRIEGPVTRASTDEADAYFADRPPDSQINAWVSEQSRPLDSPAMLQRRASEQAAAFGLDWAELGQRSGAAIPRPPHWGGYRLWIERVEFWIEGTGRFHERTLYQRSIDGTAYRADPDTVWRVTRLQP